MAGAFGLRHRRLGQLPPVNPQDIAPGNVGWPSFSRLEPWRGIATSYDERALNCRAGVVIASIVLSWPR